MERKCGVAAADAINEVILKCLDLLFYSIGLVQMGWHELVADAFVLHEGFQAGWVFFVPASGSLDAGCDQ